MMTVSVCVSLCVCLSVRDHSFGPTRAIFTKLFAHVTYGRSSVLLWRRSDMLCTSGFMYDVIFAHEPRSLDVSRPAEAQCTRSLGLGYKLCAIILLFTTGSQRPHRCCLLGHAQVLPTESSSSCEWIRAANQIHGSLDPVYISHGISISSAVSVRHTHIHTLADLGLFKGG